jgi:23S rRNA pseudouridine1911/1915/1917 synthase
MTDSDLVRLLVAPTDAGQRLDIFLARDPRIGSRRRAKELIDATAVQLPGLRRPAKAGQVLEPGQWVEVELLPVPPPPTVAEVADGVEPLRVLHADPFLVVIDKRPGIAAHPPEGARNYRTPTVATLAEAAFGPLPRLGGDDRPGIVHRLDKDTSGVMLIARTEEAFHFLQSQFKARTIEKEYRCLSYGEARFESDWMEGAIADHPTRADRMQVVREGGREAVTYYEVVERLGGYTHFRCLPKTGRTHQIRLHMETAGYSLVGDKVYRARNQQHLTLPPGCPPAERQMLHAFQIRLQHPWSHETLTFTAPIPPDMETVLAWLRQRPR